MSGFWKNRNRTEHLGSSQFFSFLVREPEPNRGMSELGWVGSRVGSCRVENLKVEKKREKCKSLFFFCCGNEQINHLWHVPMCPIPTNPKPRNMLRRRGAQHRGEEHCQRRKTGLRRTEQRIASRAELRAEKNWPRDEWQSRAMSFGCSDELRLWRRARLLHAATRAQGWRYLKVTLSLGCWVMSIRP